MVSGCYKSACDLITIHLARKAVSLYLVKPLLYSWKFALCKMERHDSLLNRLADLLDSRKDRDQSASPAASSTSSASTSTSDGLQRLFPSIARSSEPKASSSSTGGQFSSRSRAKKKPYDKPARQIKPVIKDIVLLPDPRIADVPRGVIREELYVRELVASAVEIPSEMNEQEMRAMLEDLFASKLKSIVGYKFQFVRAVGNKVVQPKINREWDAKMVKHIAGQGPVYLRSWQKIEKDFSWVADDREDDDDEGDEDSELERKNTLSSDDEKLMKPAFEDKKSDMSSCTPGNQPSDPSPPISSSSQAALIIDVDACHSHTTPVANVSHITELPSASVPAVLCPTCHKSFPLRYIEEHADMCCERHVRAPELAYANLMLTMEDQGNVDGSPSEDVAIVAQEQDNKKPELKDIMQRIVGRVSAKKSQVNIQRKLILDDYVDGRKRPWFKPQNSLSVVFIGEPAVDDGGPKREFFTGAGTGLIF